MSIKSLIRIGCVDPGSKDKSVCKLSRNKTLQSLEAKISQFADDTTLICRDENALRENMNVLNKFNDISGLKLNKKKN